MHTIVGKETMGVFKFIMVVIFMHGTLIYKYNFTHSHVKIGMLEMI